MTSKNYLCNSIKENIRRNFPLLVLIALVLLAVLPVRAAISMDAARNYMENPMSKLNPVQQAFVETVGFTEIMIPVILAAGAVIGLVQFFYLYSGEKTDFFHCLPLKREQLFGIHYISGLIIFFVPYVVSVFLAYVVGVGYQAVTSIAIKSMGISVGLTALYFLIMYEAAILAVLLTGNLFMGILGYAGLLSYGYIFQLTFQGMNDRFFDTIANIQQSEWKLYLSPVLAYGDAIYHYREGESVWNYVIYGILLAAVLLALGVYIYKVRPSESYQRAIAFPKLQPVIKVAVVFLFSLAGGLFISGATAHRFLWLAGDTIIAGLILSCVFEFIYTLDIKKCIRPRVSTGIILAVLALILVGYRKDITGYDTYLPQKEKIETMSVYFESINGQLSYPSGYHGWDMRKYMQEVRIENFDAVYQLASKGVEYYKDNTQNSDVMVSVYIGYHLKSGKDVYRCYYLPETEELVENIGEIYDNWEYRQKLLPTSYIDEEKISYFYINDFYQAGEQLDVKGENLRNLYKTYKSELEEMSFEQSRKYSIIGYLQVKEAVKPKDAAEYDYRVDATGILYEDSYLLPVYANFTKTRAALEKAGYSMKECIVPEDVKNIHLWTYEEASGDKVDVVVEDEANIERIVKQLTFCDGYYSVASDICYHVNVEVKWKENERETRSQLYLRKNKSVESIFQQLNID